MCRAAQEAGGPHRGYKIIYRKKMSFSHLCISVISYPIVTKVAAQLPAHKGSPHSKFEGNHSSHFRDTSSQSFFFLHFSSSSFRTLAKLLLNTNSYFDRLEIWHTERESKGKSYYQIWCKPDERLRIYV